MKLAQVAPACEIQPHCRPGIIKRRFLAFCFYVSAVWNISSPLRAWYLTRYGFVPTHAITTIGLQWNTVLNGRLLTALYKASGISVVDPIPPTRYINVFLDFLVIPLSKLKWAASFNDSQAIYQMDIEGESCRCSLNGTKEITQFNNDIMRFTNSGFALWGSEIVYNYIPPAPTKCNLQEVTEAVLCLKGMALEDFVNSQFISKLSPYTNISHREAIAMWRQKSFPDLSDCLQRRAFLLTTSTSPTQALLKLSSELAIKYDLGLDNIAGSRQLYQAITFFDGFMDISSTHSGIVSYQISGPDPMHTLSASSGFLDAMLVPRETAWWCSIQYIDSRTNRANLTKCFEEFSTTLPSFFYGKYLQVNSGTRYLDNKHFIRGQTQGKITPYYHKIPQTMSLNDIEYTQQGNMTSWNYLFKDLLAEIYDKPVDTTIALEELCLVGDGCFSSCMNASASGGTTLAFMRGGECVTKPDTIAHVLSDLYTDIRCFGLGKGTSNVLITYMTSNGTRQQVVVNNTASPMAIWACFIGGRVPVIDYPSYLVDLLGQGAQSTLVVMQTNGSEAIVLNFISLLSLVGYCYFSIVTQIFLWRVAKWYRGKRDSRSRRQQYYSLINSNLSSVIFARHRLAIKCTGFLSFIAWHIGATKMGCKWSETTQAIAMDPVYECSLDVWGHVSSISELVNLISHSWVFFSLVFLDTMPGICIDLSGYLLAWLFLGFFPLTLLAVFVAQLCRWRLSISCLSWVPNQLVIVLIWLVVFLLLRSKYFHTYLSLVDRALGCIGITKQTMNQDSPFHKLIGSIAWISPVPDNKYLPLSLLLECPTIDLYNVIDHEYYTCGLKLHARQSGSYLNSPMLPKWLESNAEYYIRIHTCEYDCYSRNCISSTIH